MMRAWLIYAAVTAALLVIAALVLSVLVQDPLAVWLAAGVAYVVQLLAFAALVRSRTRGLGFVAGWGGGMALRFLALAGMAAGVTLSDARDPATALLSLVGFVMVLVLVEPLFFRWAE
jgi:hypothetical protein